MPSSMVHQYACELIFNKPYRSLNKFMDAPSVHLGKSHRRLYHNELFARVVSEKLCDINAYFAAKLHVALDYHPESNNLEDLIKTEKGRAEADFFIQYLYHKYVLGTRSFDEMKRMVAEDHVRLIPQEPIEGLPYEKDDPLYDFCHFMIRFSETEEEKREWINKLLKMRKLDLMKKYL